MKFSESDDKVIDSCVLLGSIYNFQKPSEYAGTAFTMLMMYGFDHEVEKLLKGQSLYFNKPRCAQG